VTGRPYDHDDHCTCRRRRSILLVDDDATNLDVSVTRSTGSGYHLFVTRSGERDRGGAAASTVADPPRRRDAEDRRVETCRRIKEDPDTRDAAVIFLSSLDDTKDKVAGSRSAPSTSCQAVSEREVVARVNRT
jgi:CheY-like chemotaxis protein